jgi:hypothetical protein
MAVSISISVLTGCRMLQPAMPPPAHRLDLAAVREFEKALHHDACVGGKSVKDLDPVGETQTAAHRNPSDLVLIAEYVDKFSLLVALQRRQRNDELFRFRSGEGDATELSRPRAGRQGFQDHFDATVARGGIQRRMDAQNPSGMRGVAQRIDTHPGAIADPQPGQRKFGDLHFGDQPMRVDQGQQVFMLGGGVARFHQALRHDAVDRCGQRHLLQAGFKQAHLGASGVARGSSAGHRILAQETLRHQPFGTVMLGFRLRPGGQRLVQFGARDAVVIARQHLTGVDAVAFAHTHFQQLAFALIDDLHRIQRPQTADPVGGMGESVTADRGQFNQVRTLRLSSRFGLGFRVATGQAKQRQHADKGTQGGNKAGHAEIRYA